jgi:hypothetical protein
MQSMDYFDQQADVTPVRAALVDGDRRYSYAEPGRASPSPAPSACDLPALRFRPARTSIAIRTLLQALIGPKNHVSANRSRIAARNLFRKRNHPILTQESTQHDAKPLIIRQSV